MLEGKRELENLTTVSIGIGWYFISPDIEVLKFSRKFISSLIHVHLFV